MKKNFMAIAALLIAAMFLVVSCSQEVAPKASVDNEPVKVTLNANAARAAVNFAGPGVDEVVYYYDLDAVWTANETNNMNAIVGETDGPVQFTGSDKTKTTLGYVSQGQWKITVTGKIEDDVVLKGETTAFITTTSNDITVFVRPVDTTPSATLGFELYVNDHGSNHTVKYEIFTANGTKIESSAVSVPEADTFGTLNPADAGTAIKKWTGTVSGLTPGYYRVVMTLNNGTTKVGGITKGVLLLADKETGNNKTALLKGSVDSSAFIAEGLEVFYPAVSVKLDDITTDNVTVGEGTTYSVTLNATTSATPLPTGYSYVGSGPQYVWYVNGEIDTTKTTKGATFNFEKYAKNEITCYAYYTVKFGENEYAVFAASDEVTVTVVKDGNEVKKTVTNK